MEDKAIEIKAISYEVKNFTCCDGDAANFQHVTFSGAVSGKRWQIWQ